MELTNKFSIAFIKNGNLLKNIYFVKNPVLHIRQECWPKIVASKFLYRIFVQLVEKLLNYLSRKGFPKNNHRNLMMVQRWKWDNWNKVLHEIPEQYVHLLFRANDRSIFKEWEPYKRTHLSSRSVYTISCRSLNLLVTPSDVAFKFHSWPVSSSGSILAESLHHIRRR